MSNEVAVLDQYDAALAAQLGLRTRDEDTMSSLSSVHINYDADDADKRQLPVGQFKIVHRKEDGEVDVFYTRTVHFRPFMRMYQIRVWTPGKSGERGKFTNQTIMVPNWFSEMRDELGGVRCGKVKYKDWPALSEAEKEAQKPIKASALVYGTVSFNKGKKIVDVTDENPEGLETVDGMEEIVCSWRMTKGNMVAMGDVLESLEKQKVFSFARKMPIGLERHQAAGAARPSYNMVFDADNFAPYPLDAGDVALIEQFQEEVSRINKGIEDKHDAAVAATPTAAEEQVLRDITGGAPRATPTPAQMAQATVIENGEDPLAGDFAEKPLDDEIPF